MEMEMRAGMKACPYFLKRFIYKPYRQPLFG